LTVDDLKYGTKKLVTGCDKVGEMLSTIKKNKILNVQQENIEIMEKRKKFLEDKIIRENA
jgi:phosphoenolpyruvate-protein kinase (PTS system EI component)